MASHIMQAVTLQTVFVALDFNAAFRSVSSKTRNPPSRAMIQGLHIWTVNGTGAQSNGEVLLGGEHAEVTSFSGS